MRFAPIIILTLMFLPGCAGAQEQTPFISQDTDGSSMQAPDTSSFEAAAQREHAIDQLTGGWVYEICDDDGNCETVVRIYEEAPETGLVRYTELYNGAENEGFVGYDLGSDGFVEFDYPQDWDSYEFEQRYMSEDESIRLFGETPFGGPEDRALQWRIDDDGQQMILRTGIGEFAEEPGEFLDVIFSRMPLIGDGEEDN